MRALLLDAPGGVESFRTAEVRTPEPTSDEVLVAVRTAGVCHHDVIARRGAFARTDYPAILGHEIAGVVAKLGPTAKGLSVGDRVVATTIWSCGRCDSCLKGNDQLCRAGRGVVGEAVPGGYADHVVLPDHALVPIPDSVSDEVAAVVPCALGTAFHALDGLHLPQGSWVVITGASGGVGLHAVMLAAGMGQRVIGVTRSARKAAAITAAGAEHVVVASEGHYARACRDIVPDGADAVLDVTSAAIGESLRTLRAGARLCVVGNVGDATVALEPALLIMKELVIGGSRGASRHEVADLLSLVVAGDVRPVVEVAGGPERIPEVHRRIEGGFVTGKQVIEW
jgi:acryloyl-coenzyme A reductase